MAEKDKRVLRSQLAGMKEYSDFFIKVEKTCVLLAAGEKPVDMESLMIRETSGLIGGAICDTKWEGIMGICRGFGFGERAISSEAKIMIETVGDDVKEL